MVKIHAPEGQIDFIVSAEFSTPPAEWREIWGVRLRLETPIEIGLKKMFHRATDLQSRDVFDLAAIIDRHDEAFARASTPLRDRLPALRERIRRLRTVYDNETADLDIRPSYQAIRIGAPEIFAAFLGRVAAAP